MPVLGLRFNLPDKVPDIAASRVDTWNNRKASSTWVSVAKARSCIFASDSAIRIIASNCLKKILLT